MTTQTLKETLKPGDQIIALLDMRYPKHISPEGTMRQHKGDIIMVNSTNLSGITSGCGIHEAVPGSGPRPTKGLGCSFADGTYRLAAPSDPGFMATKEQWREELLRPLKRERLHSTLLAVLASGLGGLAIYFWAQCALLWP